MRRVNHLPVSNINSNMASVAYQIARLRVTDRYAAASLRLGCPWQRDSRYCMAVLYQP